MEKEIHLYINGRPMDFRVYIAVIKDGEDKFVGTLVVFDNLTEVIMAQRALAWQERHVTRLLSSLRTGRPMRVSRPRTGGGIWPLGLIQNVLFSEGSASDSS